MRILIGWDDPAELELISLYLQAGGNEILAAASPDEIRAQLGAAEPCDVALLAVTFPDHESGLAVFRELLARWPECPVVGACRTDAVYQMARFLTGGLRSYVLRDLGGDFVFLLQSTLESTVAAVRAERERRAAEKMREEIEAVRRFQDSIIPRRFPAPNGYELAGRYEPSEIRVLGGQPVQLAGGDYFDVLPLDRHTLALLMGDASGHGMRACMSILVLHTLVGMMVGQRHKTTAAFVQEVNRAFCGQAVNQKDGSLVALFFGLLRTDRHELTWTSAGHPIPLLDDRRAGRIGPIAPLDAGGPPLGVDEDVRYDVHTLKLPPTARLLIYTDGLVEAFPEAEPRNLFGEERTCRIVERHRTGTRDAVLDALLSASHDHTRGAGRHDDTSLLLVERGA